MTPVSSVNLGIMISPTVDWDSPGGGGAAPNAILQETGGTDYLLLETGGTDYILLES